MFPFWFLIFYWKLRKKLLRDFIFRLFEVEILRSSAPVPCSALLVSHLLELVLNARHLKEQLILALLVQTRLAHLGSQLGALHSAFVQRAVQLRDLAAVLLVLILYLVHLSLKGSFYFFIFFLLYPYIFLFVSSLNNLTYFLLQDLSVIRIVALNALGAFLHSELSDRVLCPHQLLQSALLISPQRDHFLDLKEKRIFNPYTLWNANTRLP